MFLALFFKLYYYGYFNFLKLKRIQDHSLCRGNSMYVCMYIYISEKYVP